MLIDYLHKESLDVKKRNLIVLPDIVVLLLLLVIVCLFHLNTTLFWNINRVSEYTGSFLWANLTILGDALVAAVVIFPFIRKKPQLVWTALMAAVVAALLVHTLKPLLDVARPADVLDNDLMNKIGPVLHRRAFPSGHTATIFTLIGVFVMYV
ncbi:hypothetical protein JW935_19660, partial [candidate division KSB1 bacterium]|nr:hypothetical protein [candidate division KSB1 bacterium]